MGMAKPKVFLFNPFTEEVTLAPLWGGTEAKLPGGTKYDSIIGGTWSVIRFPLKTTDFIVLPFDVISETMAPRRKMGIIDSETKKGYLLEAKLQ